MAAIRGAPPRTRGGARGTVAGTDRPVLAVGGHPPIVRLDHGGDRRLPADLGRGLPGERQAGEPGGTEGGTVLATGVEGDGAVERRGEDARPEAAAGAAADGGEVGDPGPRDRKAVLCFGQGEGDALEHGLDEVDRRGVRVDAEEDPARVRVVVRRALAGEVRQEQKARRAVPLGLDTAQQSA